VNGEDHCALHGYEPVPPIYYVICGECRHVFVTANELVEADRAVRRDCGLPDVPQRPNTITVCPLCTHDL
jgi:hypothetical protein